MLERVVGTRADRIAPLAECLAGKRRILVLTGAGVSSEAGIPDYRDADGAWKRPAPVAFQDFMARADVRRRYWARSLAGWPVFAAASPTAGHRALAALERADRLLGVVSQNVDELHRRAGSCRVIDLHGRLGRVRCMDCSRRLPRSRLQQLLLLANPGFAVCDAPAAPDGDAELANFDLAGFSVADCPHCGGLLKPDVTFFGEAIPPARTRRAEAAVAAADALLVVGTSLMAFSAFRLVRLAARRKIPVLALNIGRTRADELFDFKLVARAGDALPALAESLGAGHEKACELV